jgi:hypothetical protein
LEPADDCLLARYGDLIGEGRQLTLPWEPHGARLQRDWLAVAIDFVNGPRRAPVQRLVLQVSVSLAGPVDRQTAVDLLLAMAAEYPLGTDGSAGCCRVSRAISGSVAGTTTTCTRATLSVWAVDGPGVSGDLDPCSSPALPVWGQHWGQLGVQAPDLP